MIRSLQPTDREELLRMRRALWPGSEEREADGLLSLPASDGIVLVSGRAGDGLRGFAEIRLRKFAEGCHGSPVAYLEGIWVDADTRRMGVASALVQTGKDWARAHGLRELASDCDIENRESEAFHLSVGFTEAQRSICFRLDLDSEAI